MARIRLIILVLTLGITACTVVPKAVNVRQIEFEGSKQTAGVLGTNEQGFVILSAAKVAEYNALINKYGTNYLVPLTNNFGLTSYTNNTFLINDEALLKFIEMKELYRNSK